jgi:hypothetical protein
MKSLITKSLVPSVLVAVSLVLTGSASMAATTQIHRSSRVAHVTHPQALAPVAARYRQPQFAGNSDLGQLIQGFFGGVLPPQYTRLIASAAARASASHRGTGSYDWSSGSSPTYDSPASPAPIDNSASDAAAAAAASNSQQELNDSMALTASMAAAEQENDAANAATLQTEINAGM